MTTGELRGRLAAEIDRLADELASQAREGAGMKEATGIRRDADAPQHPIRARIQRLRSLLAGLDLAHPETLLPGRVGYGSVVRVEEVGSGDVASYTIMSGDAVDLDAGEISIASPVAQALLGRAPGDEVDVRTPQRRLRLRIVSVRTIHERAVDGASPEAGDPLPPG